MGTETLRQLSEMGVALWLDDMSRGRLVSGSLHQLVDDRHVVGITTNPTIFHKAVSEGDVYDEQLRDLAHLEITAAEAVRLITSHDVRAVCDLMRPVFERTGGRDGRVSIEVDPGLAHDTAATIAEARLLWWLVDRPNLLIKIPGTPEGLPAIRTCLAEAISVNVTLLFSLARYREVVAAFLDGLEQAHTVGHDLSQIQSVASFFVSRVDTEVDRRLDKIGTAEAHTLRGEAAIANARLAHEHHQAAFTSDRWRRLKAAGARPQRLLWASTGVKDPSYDPTRYVIELVAPQTVNTMPEPTLKAVEDQGTFRGDTVRDTYDDARRVLDRLDALGVDYDDVVATLEDEGVDKFQASWQELSSAVESKLVRLRGTKAGT